MRTRPWIPWLIFAIGTLLVLEGLAWVTWQALRFESSDREARAESKQQEAIRLALWRMESELAPILAQESARPYFQFRSFYSADGAYDRMWRPVGDGSVLVPSPLLESAGLYSKLHFQIEADGTLTSPQVPNGAMRTLALSGSIGVTPELLMLSERRLAELRVIIGEPAAPATAGVGLDQLKEETTTAASASSSRDARAGLEKDEPELLKQSKKVSPPPQQQFDTGDYQARQQAVQSAREYGEQSNVAQRAGRMPQQAVSSPSTVPASTNQPQMQQDSMPAIDLGHALQSGQGGGGNSPFADQARPAPGSPAADVDFQRMTRQDDATGVIQTAPNAIEQGAFEAHWITRTHSADATPSELVLTRSVLVDGARATQGVWLDWPALSARLAHVAQDLVPGSKVEPVMQGVQVPDQGRMLATIPARLQTQAGLGLVDPIGISSTRITLAATWIAVLGAIGAIGWVLRSSLDLSDRRGRFVSAVTHELRTPLTSFCLYTEMLADGMIRDEGDRARYLGTLKGESKRLARIVENVLEYSRLSEVGRAPRVAAGSGVESIPLAALLERPWPSLEARAASSQMAMERYGSVPEVRVQVDPISVERILFNLVDNACKYAREAADRRIVVTARLYPNDPGLVGIEVRDFGPGVVAHERRRIFKPFHRSMTTGSGDEDQGGLGLGLALARELARQMGGDLVLLPNEGEGSARGARFELRLRRVPGT